MDSKLIRRLGSVKRSKVESDFNTYYDKYLAMAREINPDAELMWDYTRRDIIFFVEIESNESFEKIL